jgi:formylglycine-generating enzyme required for sulfatase activity
VISTTTRTQDGVVTVYVPAGTFTMGADLAPDDQSPAHEVTLDAFWLDQTEMTNGRYDLCVAAGVCGEDEFPRDRDLNGDAQPVVGVSWYDAEAYCTWVGGRLPTEAEWEYAARGPENRTYPWGEEPRVGIANCGEDDCVDGFMATAPVGSFPEGASWVGALDMAGNVWEWVNDWYRGGYYGWSPKENPPGPETGRARVLRGGSWEYNWANVRSRNRSAAGPHFLNTHVGFRCAIDVPGG